MASSLKIVSEVTSADVIDTQKVVQNVADSIALLGNASYQLSLKRRTFIRSTLKDDYKDICSKSTEMSEKLFGDNLSKHMKDINMRNKMKINNQSFSSYKSNKPYNRQSSFLGRGRRGNAPSTAYSTRRHQNKPRK